MARSCWSLALCLLTTASAVAQTPDDEDRGTRRRERGNYEERGEGEERGRGDRGDRGDREGGMFRRPNPIFEAIDANSDGVISESELRKAATAIRKLDADGDGAITLAEVSPPGGPGGPGGRFGGDQFVDRVMENDKNGDGTITVDEVDQGDERTTMMLRNADQDGDGSVTREELVASMERFRQGGGPGGNFGPGGMDSRQIRASILRYDVDRDGKLSTQEAQGIPDQARQMLQGRDLNEDGFIDASEMEQMARRMGGRFVPGGQAGPRDRFDRGGRGDDEAEDGEEGNRRRRPQTEEEEER